MKFRRSKRFRSRRARPRFSRRTPRRYGRFRGRAKGYVSKRYRSKGKSSLRRFTFYHNFLPWWNDPAAVPAVVASPGAFDTWIGDHVAYPPGNLDALGNPTAIGAGGLLETVNRRHLQIDVNNRRYSAVGFDANTVMFFWNRVNPQVPFTSINVKGLSVYAYGRDSTQTDLFFVATRRFGDTSITSLRESNGRCKTFIRAYTDAAVSAQMAQGIPVAANVARWTNDPTFVAGPVGARIKCVLYYRLNDKRVLMS